MLNSDTKTRKENECSVIVQTLPLETEFTYSNNNYDRLSYSKMVLQTVDGTEELQDCLYKYKIKTKLPRNFARDIIELENLIDMHYSQIDENIIEKLACLYKVL